MPSSSGSSNMGGGIGGSGDSTRSRGPGKDQGGKGSGGLRFSAKEASQFGGLQGGALGQQISNFNASIARRGRTQQLNEIAQTLNLLPTNLFAFSPVKDQARFIGELAGQGLAPGQTMTTEGGVTLQEGTIPAQEGTIPAQEGTIPAQEGTPTEFTDIPGGATAQQQQQSFEALTQPFTDPIGFLTDAFSSESLKETLPLALDASGTFRALGGIIGEAFSKFTTYTPKAGIAATGARAVANNAKNYGLKASYLARLAATAKSPKAVLGLLSATLYTSLFWAQNEKGDALTTLVIIQRDAAKNGDRQSVREINELIQETNDIAASIPVIGFIEAELAKFKAAVKASETTMKNVGIK